MSQPLSTIEEAEAGSQAEAVGKRCLPACLMAYSACFLMGSRPPVSVDTTRSGLESQGPRAQGRGLLSSSLVYIVKPYPSIHTSKEEPAGVEVTPSIPALRQDHHEFEASLGYTLKAQQNSKNIMERI